MATRGYWRMAPLLALVWLLACLPMASAAIPIPGKLLVSGSDGYNPIAYFMIGDTDSVTPAPVAFYGGDISPDGTQVVYNVGVTDTLLEIWRSGIGGSSQVNLTQTAGIGGVNCAAQWSPDGSQIAFHRSEPAAGQLPCDAGFHVWVMDAGGSNAHRVTPTGFSPTRVPVWSPDGHQLLCEADWLGIITMDTDGSNAVVLPNVGGSPAISPDGSKIVSSQSAYSDSAKGTYRRLLLTNADGSNPQVLVERFISDADVLAHLAHLGLPADDLNIGVVQWNVGPGAPRWAPTGDMIAYSAATPLDVQGPNFDLQREVWIYDLATGTATQVTDNSWCDAGFSWHGNNTYPDYPEVTVNSVTVAFDQVTGEGLTTIIRDDGPPALLTGYEPAGAFYQIDTTAQVTGATTISMTYSDGDVAPTAESHLAILGYDGSQWQKVAVTRDTTANEVSGDVNALGLMGLAYSLPASSFSDVSSDPADPYWALWEIEAAYAAGIVKGSGGYYFPSDPVTRDQLAVYIARAMNGADLTGSATVPFVDITNPWANVYIAYCIDHGVVKGFDATHYGPTLEVDRGSMAVFIARAKGWVSIDDAMNTAPELFADVPAGYWSGTAIQACVDHGVVNGYDATHYQPTWIVSRDQMAVFVTRAFNLPM